MLNNALPQQIALLYKNNSNNNENNNNNVTQILYGSKNFESSYFLKH